MTIWLFFITIFALIGLGCPIVFAFLAGSVLYFILIGQGLAFALKVMLDGTSSFILMAIPFFILAAHLFDEASVTDRIFGFAGKAVGHWRGGLAHVNILNSLIFSGMSGSAVADTSGIGALSARAMTKAGFSREFSAAITISSSIIGPIIPPSIPVLIIAAVTNVSVGQLFLGGIGPGIVMALALFVYCWAISFRRDFPRQPKASMREVLKAFVFAAPALFTPVILMGGIYSGMFTPTEAAAVASLYALLLVPVYGGRYDARRLIALVLSVAKMTAMVMLLVATVADVSWIVTVERLPEGFASWILRLELSTPALLLVFNIVLLALGALLPTEVMIFLFIPIIFPAAVAAGIDPVHFCIVAIVNLMIGLNTPPFGLQLFVASGVLKLPIRAILSESWPMLVVMGAMLLLITYCAPVVTFLPQLLD